MIHPTMNELALLLVHIRDVSPRRARSETERLRRELQRVSERDGYNAMHNGRSWNVSNAESKSNGKMA